MRKISANYIFPVSQPPVQNGIIIAEDSGTIIEDVINPDKIDYEISDVEHYDGFICPGFVNAHCHLELSYLHEKMPEHCGLDQFIIQLEKIRKNTNETEKAEAVAKAESLMLNNGIVAVGDISNNNSTFPIKEKSKIHFHTFIEAFASDSRKAAQVFEKALHLYNELGAKSRNNAVSITPHAPYSLSKGLFSKIKAFAESNGSIISMHHQESEEENKFFLTKSQGLEELHKTFGVERSDFSNTGKRPLESIAEFLPKSNRFQLVHNTVSQDFDIDYAQELLENAYWCLCPNANLFIEKKLPDFALFMNRHCKITIGTDSLASNNTLSILEELKTIHFSMLFVPLHELLKWACLHGAEFLGINKFFGSIEKGKHPGLNLIERVNTAAKQLSRESRVSVILGSQQ